MRNLHFGAVLASAALAVLTGCGSGVGSPSTPSLSAESSGAGKIPSATPAPTLDSGAATALVTDAISNLTVGPGYRVVFNGSDRYGPASFDLTSDGRGALSGILTTRRVTGTVLLTGHSTYVRGPDLVNKLLVSNSFPAISGPDSLRWAWIASAPPGNGFFDGLAAANLLIGDCLRPGTASVYQEVARTAAGGAFTTVTVAEEPTRSVATVGRFTISNPAKPNLLRWAITDEIGVEAGDCPGGPEQGASAGLFRGTLDFFPLSSRPAIATPADFYSPIPHDGLSQSAGG